MSFDGWYHQCAKDGQESAVHDGESCKWCGLNESQYRLTRYTDDEVRDECVRRDLPVIKWAAGKQLIEERDEWRRRAETAELGLASRDIAARAMTRFVRVDTPKTLEAVMATGSADKRVLHGYVERGPGIAATKPDDSLDIDPLDLLADDA